MNEIYVIGHHNPDTDSIVSAMAYAALRNALGDRNYVAAHMDHISDQTQRMLDRFGFQPPRTVQNVRTQVEDLDYDTPPALNATVTMDRAWHIMREQRISAILYWSLIGRAGRTPWYSAQFPAGRDRFFGGLGRFADREGTGSAPGQSPTFSNPGGTVKR